VCESVDRIQLDQDRVQWWAVVKFTFGVYVVSEVSLPAKRVLASQEL
jgi:hypothetical protein